MSELYFSCDIESDGPIPGVNSMLSFGVAVFTPKGEMISTFSANLEVLEGAVPNHETMLWWAKNKEAYAKTRQDKVAPEAAMGRFVSWVDEVCRTNGNASPVFVAYPASFDHGFVHWYLMRFVGRDPFGFSALDMKSYAMAKLGTNFRQTTKASMPKEWFKSEREHTHVALDDAIEQGFLFIEMLKAT